LEIIICVGSSCHLKGSYDVIKELERLIELNHMEDKIELKASFCMGNCTKGVSAMLNGKTINYLTKNNVEKFFNEEIMGRKTP